MTSETVGERAIRALLLEWVESFKAKDLARQTACYADPVAIYYRKRNATHALVAADKSRAFAVIGTIQTFRLDDIQITLEAPDRATATFTKTWDTTLVSGRPYAGSERERLTLVQADGAWKISGEQEMQVYYLKH